MVSAGVKTWRQFRSELLKGMLKWQKHTHTHTHTHTPTHSSMAFTLASLPPETSNTADLRSGPRACVWEISIVSRSF